MPDINCFEIAARLSDAIIRDDEKEINAIYAEYSDDDYLYTPVADSKNGLMLAITSRTVSLLKEAKAKDKAIRDMKIKHNMYRLAHWFKIEREPDIYSSVDPFAFRTHKNDILNHVRTHTLNLSNEEMKDMTKANHCSMVRKELKTILDCLTSSNTPVYQEGIEAIYKLQEDNEHEYIEALRNRLLVKRYLYKFHEYSTNVKMCTKSSASIGILKNHLVEDLATIYTDTMCMRPEQVLNYYEKKRKGQNERYPNNSHLKELEEKYGSIEENHKQTLEILKREKERKVDA